VSLKQRLQRIVPAWLLRARRRLFQRKNAQQILQSMPESARELYRRSALADYSEVSLSPEDERIQTAVMDAAVSIYGETWNHYSDALRPEIALGFIKTLNAITAQPASYLEIGSNRGLSMAFIAMLLRNRGQLGRLVSIDPYFDSGYSEGALGPYQAGQHVQIDQTTKVGALRLYGALDLKVELMEQTSEVALKELVKKDEHFDLIYIDGYHEQLVPTVDFGLSYAVLSKPGVIILDDHLWPDVLPLKMLCDKHATRVQETWKTASYLFS
jgi:predicted O-methyltransferase YrrM